ncbi:MAG TPA: SBBP repeat-containing protein, partial [Burkholderiales bacterium]|nr:SBBP repeat-containing protein [Burkholderiales bacterium]
SGSAYVTGSTSSADFPTVNPLRPALGGSEDTIFVSKFNPSGSALVYSTYLGGSVEDDAKGIAVDAVGNAYVTGLTLSTDFPTTPGAFQLTFGGGASNAFVTKLNPTGSGLVYSTYLGGSGGGGGGEGGKAIALDSAGNAYVAGGTDSSDFPTTAGAFQTTGGDTRAFVAKIGPFNTLVGTNVSVSAGNHVTVTFATVVSPGDTGATTSSTGPIPPAGFTFGTPPTYYDVTTTATYAPPVTVCIAYNPAQFGDPASLRLFHFESNAWADVTTSNDTGAHVLCGQVTSFSPFAIGQRGRPLTSLGPTNIWVGLKNSDDVGIRFDLRAEAYRNGTQLVGSGEVAGVSGGSSGFNNAKQDAITLTPVGGATFVSGDTLSIKLYVRNACSGSGKNSGTARLWLNDNAANSRFGATLGSPATYFLRDAFALATTSGLGPQKTIDVAAGAKCSTYKTFGTWSTAIQ